ncbi:MAG: hypothetical protein A2W99_15600 [Bacteroidetes bacterium GWF2_33_16]|nr:MAG: hypothetical protein A2X00_14945 [Bacteroidetes bacterium GWE2_32_14]OFY02334.1 MAG: hypothetical protein A2W99_15600 [Bacteroidetes bacterium GWF2_33_16]
MSKQGNKVQQKTDIMKKSTLLLCILLSISILPIYAQNDSTIKSLELTPQILEKLSSDQILDLIKEKERLKYEHEKAMAEKFAVNPQVLLDNLLVGTADAANKIMPSESLIFFFLVIFFIFLLMLVFIPFYFNQRKSNRRLEMLNKYLDKDISKELMQLELETRSDLHKGIILISLGLSISLALYLINPEKSFWTIGIIPTIIGIGYFITFIVDKTNRKN